MENKICSFFGHRKIEITKELEKSLYKQVEELIHKDFNIFYFGGFGEFDELCHKVVTNLKITHPYIKRVFCLTEQKHLNEFKRPRWLKNKDYEQFIYLNLDFDWWYKRIFFRNLEMIKQSDYVIFYVNKKENSGAYKCMQFAIKNKTAYVNLGEI